jgi:hypothetical protein
MTADEGVPLRFPVWVLVTTDALRETGLPAAVAVLGGAAFGYFVPLFTGLDAATRFLGGAPLPGVSPLALGTPPVLGAVLDDFYRRGVSSCGLDLHYLPGEESPTGRFFPSRSLIEAIFGKSG